jgi:hypothetical protein
MKVSSTKGTPPLLNAGNVPFFVNTFVQHWPGAAGVAGGKK